MTDDLKVLRELLAAGVKQSDSGWYVGDITSSGLSLIVDGLSHGMFPIACEAPQAALIVAAVNALPSLLDRIEALEAERDELVAGLKPFAMAFDAVQKIDPHYPDDAAVLRASHDYWTREGGGNVRQSDLRKAAALITKHTTRPTDEREKGERA